MANQRGIVAGWDVDNNIPKGVTSAADLRTSIASIARSEGIMQEAGAAQVSFPDTNMGIDWTAFTAVIASPLGGWLCPRIDSGGINLETGDDIYPRIDVVWVKQHDYQTDADHPDSEVEVGVTSGTPAATPDTPAIPTGALAVFTIEVPSNARLGEHIGAAGSVKRCRWTAPQGGVLAASSDTEASALVVGVNASEDVPVLVYRTDLGQIQVWDGTQWATNTPQSWEWTNSESTFKTGSLVNIRVGTPASGITPSGSYAFNVPAVGSFELSVLCKVAQATQALQRQFVEIYDWTTKEILYRQCAAGDDQVYISRIPIENGHSVGVRAYAATRGDSVTTTFTLTRV